MKRFEAPAGIVLMLLRKVNGRSQVLLQKRKNTGFADGFWDFSCSGHIEKDESMSDAVLRECREELGIELKKQDIRHFCFIHKKDTDCIYYYGYFVCENFDGTPEIMEPEKCSQLLWADMDNLPDKVIPDRIAALKAFNEGIHYLEYGWDQL